MKKMPCLVLELLSRDFLELLQEIIGISSLEDFDLV
jgi:hypothetical protein